MGTPPLVEADIKDGRRVSDAVRKAIPVRRAFWAYFVGPEEWRLVIVTSLVDSQGPIAAYDTLQRAIPAGTLPLRRVTVLGPSDSLVKRLASTPRSEGAVTITSSAGSTASGSVDSIYFYPKV